MSSITTIDHDEIRKWAEARGGKPAAVKGTGGKNDAGMLRLEFPDNPRANDDGLAPISWDDWFEAFDANGLALVYQEVTAEGKKSSFNKLVSREASGVHAEKARPAPHKKHA